MLWQRRDPAFEPVVTGFIWTGTRCVSVLLDTGATHCFIGAQLVSLFQLQPRSSLRPAAVRMASPDTKWVLPLQIGEPLALGSDVLLQELIDMSPLDLGPGLDVILGGDWIPSHDLRFLFPRGTGAGMPDTRP